MRMDTRIHPSTEAYVAAEKYHRCALLSVNRCGDAKQRTPHLPNRLIPPAPCLKKPLLLVIDRQSSQQPKTVSFNDNPQVLEYPLLYDEKFFKLHGYQMNKYLALPRSIIENLKKWSWLY